MNKRARELYGIILDHYTEDESTAFYQLVYENDLLKQVFRDLTDEAREKIYGAADKDGALLDYIAYSVDDSWIYSGMVKLAVELGVIKEPKLSWERLQEILA